MESKSPYVHISREAMHVRGSDTSTPSCWPLIADWGLEYRDIASSTWCQTSREVNTTCKHVYINIQSMVPFIAGSNNARSRSVDNVLESLGTNIG